MPAFPANQKPHFTKSKYWNDFNMLLSQKIDNIEIIKYMYDNLVSSSISFDINELWELFSGVNDSSYVYRATKYIAYLGGNVNHIIKRKTDNIEFPAFTLCIWHKDKESIELLLTQYDCNVNYIRPGEKISLVEYYAKEKGLTDFVSYCLEKRKLIVKNKELEEQLAEYNKLKNNVEINEDYKNKFDVLQTDLSKLIIEKSRLIEELEKEKKNNEKTKTLITENIALKDKLENSNKAYDNIFANQNKLYIENSELRAELIRREPYKLKLEQMKQLMKNLGITIELP